VTLHTHLTAEFMSECKHSSILSYVFRVQRLIVHKDRCIHCGPAKRNNSAFRYEGVKTSNLVISSVTCLFIILLFGVAWV
jgi:hypothetical protein